MNEEKIFVDDPIEYYKKNIREPEGESFNTIFLGCPKPSKMPLWVILSICLGVYFILSTFISNCLLIPMSVDGASMYPTLNCEYVTTGNSTAQDVVYLWPTQTVAREDIIVFDANPYIKATKSSTPTYYIKRVIAIAGDTIQFIKSNSNSPSTTTYDVYLNGELLIENYIYEPIKYSGASEKSKLVTNEEPIVVPSGHVFVMGDNRNNSRDSRELGFIATSDIAGKMVIHIPYGRTLIYGIVQAIKNDYIF